MARIATSVSAYAVSSSSFVPGVSRRTCSSISMPVISGIRWSETTSATGRSRSASCPSVSSASGPEVARMTW